MSNPVNKTVKPHCTHVIWQLCFTTLLRFIKPLKIYKFFSISLWLCNISDLYHFLLIFVIMLDTACSDY